MFWLSDYLLLPWFGVIVLIASILPVLRGLPVCLVFDCLFCW